jgi:hypothetical protein
VVAPEKPTDSTWCDRAGAEKVMGFCIPGEHTEFSRQARMFDDMLVSRQSGYLPAEFDYDDKDDEVVGEPDPLLVGRALEDWGLRSRPAQIALSARATLITVRAVSHS